MNRKNVGIMLTVAALILPVIICVHLTGKAQALYDDFEQKNPDFFRRHDNRYYFTRDGLLIRTTGEVITDAVIKFANGQIWQVKNTVPVCLSGNLLKVVTTHPLLFLHSAACLVIGIVLAVLPTSKASGIAKMDSSKNL